MTPSAHERYRQRLHALSEPAALASHLDEWARARDIPPVEQWERDYGRFHPGAPAWAVLAFTGGTRAPGVQASVRVDVHETSIGAPDLVPVEDVGWVRVVGAADDPRLGGLGGVLSQLRDPRVVRYRPGSRCTVRGVSAEGNRFVKVAPGTEHTQADARELWCAQTSGLLPFAVAQPHGWSAETTSSWYGVVAGAPIAAAVLGADGAAVARRLGEALGALASAPLRPTAVEGPDAQLARTERAVRRAERTLPELAGPLRAQLSHLASRHESLQPRRLVPVHGAPHMHQWLDDEGQLGLIDFDRFALGEPELDLATFLSELDSDGDRLAPMSELEDALVAGFEWFGPSLDPDRLALYRLHKRIAKVARTAYALRADGDMRSARHLASLTRCEVAGERVG